MVNNLLLVFLCICILTSCRNKTKAIQDRNKMVLIDVVQDPNINMSHVDTVSFTLDDPGKAVINRFKSTRFVQLETNSKCLIGKIQKIICYKNDFYIHNFAGDKSSIMKFDRNGIFKAKIEKMGRGPGEYIKLGDFDIDVNGNIYILDWMQSNKLLVYNPNFEYDKTITLENSILTFGISNQSIWGYTGGHDFKSRNNRKYLIFEMDKNGNVRNNYFPYEYIADRNYYSHNNIFTKNRNTLYINMPFTDIIYSVDSLNYIRGEYCLEYKVKSSMGEYMNRFDNDRFKLFYPLSNAILVQTSTLTDGENPFSIFLLGYYHLGNRDVDFVNTWNLKDDFARSVLTSSWANSVRGILNDSTVVYPMEILSILEVYKRNTGKYNQLKKEYRDIVDKLNEDDNPVLFLNPIQ